MSRSTFSALPRSATKPYAFLPHSKAESQLRTQFPEMCAFYSFDRLDPLSNLVLLRDRLITRPRFSSFHSPLALLVLSAKDFLDFDFDLEILYLSSIPVDLRHSYCRHPHYHHYHPQYQHFPALLPSANFFGAAADLIYHKHTEEEHYVRSVGNGFDSLKLGLDRGIGPRIGTSESKWKRTAEIKGKKMEGFDQKYKCAVETNGAFKKGMRWTVNTTAHLASVSTQDVCERGQKEKKVKRTMPRFVEIDEETDQQVVSKRQALPKRTVRSSKGKKKELSPQDAAMAIQKTFRDHLSRRSRTLHSLRDLAVAKSKLKEIRALFSKFSYRHRLSKDAEERQRFSEKIVILLLTVDAIEGEDSMVRSAKSSMTRELEAVLEMVDPQPYPELGSRRPKLDPPVVSFPTEIASGVADVVRMLDQDDGSSSILPDLSL